MNPNAPTRAWLQGGGAALCLAALAAALGYIQPLLSQHSEVPWEISALVGAALAGISVIGGGTLASRWLAHPNPGQQADTSTIAALSAVVTATAPSIAPIPPTPVPGQPARPVEFGTLTNAPLRPAPPREGLLPPPASPPTP